ncbi:uncharacterized protein LOC143052043 [Mytilus galloprovincialis]|uniref:uncharacterized protein LOC143052043 n=1 Tax=Mytilus galloprovincialis TaxID=29158 RepID=UPI003F7B8D6B
MMIKCHVWTISIVTSFCTLSVYQILILNVESFNLKCPAQAHWKLRAKASCTNTMKYYCLFNYIKEKYVEGCNGPDWDRKGSKRIYAGSFTRGYCTQERFQPFKFWTNGSMSDCTYTKSICSEEGQVVYKDDSRKEDRSCGCDYTQNYSFIIIPKNLCFCIPTDEDCSCYLKSCPVNYTLSADYECLPSNYNQTSKCINIRYSESKDKEGTVLTQMNNVLFSKKYTRIKWNRDTSAATVLYSLCLVYISVAGVFFFVVLFDKWTSQQLESLNICIQRKQTDAVVAEVKTNEPELDETDRGPNHEFYENNSCYKRQNADRADEAAEETVLVDTAYVREQNQLTTDEINFLRMIHLLFRVACPVVRMKFNLEIKPNQLRKTLVKHNFNLNKRYRRKEIINCVQWELLYPQDKEKSVTSENFDIRLMVYLLSDLAKISVGDLYPVQSDLSIGAMLSRIKFIRNEATQSYEGKLSEEKFNQYWDDIGQALFKLVSMHVENKHDKVKTQLISKSYYCGKT